MPLTPMGFVPCKAFPTHQALPCSSHGDSLSTFLLQPPPVARPSLLAASSGTFAWRPSVRPRSMLQLRRHRCPLGVFRLRGVLRLGLGRPLSRPSARDLPVGTCKQAPPAGLQRLPPEPPASPALAGADRPGVCGLSAMVPIALSPARLVPVSAVGPGPRYPSWQRLLKVPPERRGPFAPSEFPDTGRSTQWLARSLARNEPDP